MLFLAFGGGFRAGYSTGKVLFLLREQINKEVGGRAGTYTNNAAWLEIRQDIVNGGLGHSLLELVLVHGRLR